MMVAPEVEGEEVREDRRCHPAEQVVGGDVRSSLRGGAATGVHGDAQRRGAASSAVRCGDVGCLLHKEAHFLITYRVGVVTLGLVTVGSFELVLSSGGV